MIQIFSNNKVRNDGVGSLVYQHAVNRKTVVGIEGTHGDGVGIDSDELIVSAAGENRREPLGRTNLVRLGRAVADGVEWGSVAYIALKR